ncbi:PAS domain S-box protein [Reyranella sp. MMS21-HV4-11]|uniref:PAS domain S-box protein n=1 Tax=Reyranella humidisoli TaxID=2849149 RepID=A0ABS6ICL5_9HYPH|nr:PAS domain S-box protein [Reyranella sp. MMS21-HV4-11]
MRTNLQRVRLALGARGVAWATAAGLVALACGAVALTKVAMSVGATEVEYSRNKAAEIRTLDQSNRALMRSIFSLSTGRRQLAESDLPVAQAWEKVQSARTAICDHLDVRASKFAELRAVCAASVALHERLAPQIAAFDPPRQLIDPNTMHDAATLHARVNDLTGAIAQEAETLVGYMADEYREALLLLTVSTGGFAAACLVLIVLVGRASILHYEQSQKAGEALDLLEETIEALPAGVTLYDRNERLLMFNSAAVAAIPLLKRPGIVGITYEELARETARLDAGGGEPLRNTPEEWIRRFRSEGELPMRQSVDGRWFEWSKKMSPNGRTVGLWVDITGVMRDFEERVQLTQRLDAEMARLRSIVESSGAMIVLVDRELTVIMANSGYTAVTGVAAAEAVGRPLKEIVDCPLDPGVLERWLSGPFEPGRVEPSRFANQIRDRQGRQRLISVTATPVLGEGRLVNSIVFLGVDDTERRDAERALFDAVRLATVGEMAATVVHEIIQPLQVINIACASAEQVLREATGEGVAPNRAFLQSKLARIASQVERAGRIAGELRTFVRGTAAEEATPFDPATAVHAAVELTQYATRQAGVTVSVSVAAGLPEVMGHVGRVEQVLVNLIVNARDAGGSAVEVSARPLLRDGRAFVQIAVEDTGPGIPSAILPQLFEAFVTTKPRSTGTGLGLRICRRIVEEMNGTITATNLAEGGVRFEVVLPAAGKA